MYARTSRGAKHWVSLLAVAGLVVLALQGAVAAQSLTAADLPVTFDPLKSAHRELFEPMFGTPFNLGFDPVGTLVFYMGTDLAQYPGDVYSNIRYVLIKSEDLAYPTLEFDARGGTEGSGNPSHVVIFGWQDYKNYYYVYAAESPETRVARVVDGQHQTLYRHGSVIWYRDRDKYQHLKVELANVDGKTVVNTYVNGELAMSYTFPAGQEPPAGRVGLGGWNGAHSAYFKNIRLSAAR